MVRRQQFKERISHSCCGLVPGQNSGPQHNFRYKQPKSARRHARATTYWAIQQITLAQVSARAEAFSITYGINAIGAIRDYVHAYLLDPMKYKGLVPSLATIFNQFRNDWNDLKGRKYTEVVTGGSCTCQFTPQRMQPAVSQGGDACVVRLFVFFPPSCLRLTAPPSPLCMSITAPGLPVDPRVQI